MKKLICALLSLLLLSSCTFSKAPVPEEPSLPEHAVTEAVPEICTIPTKMSADPMIGVSPLLPVLELTEEEKNMLLKLGMAERGHSGCTECIALIMCTVLNRVEAERFGRSIRSVILAQDQFTPVTDGSYYNAAPNELCYDALEMVVYGWDESQGALYYEWCEGESWHSRNLHLLMQHCDVRFYD